MNHSFDAADDDQPLNRRERELTLSTGAILGIFFALVLLCGLFFGFGYNMGRRSTPVMAGTADSAYENSAGTSAAFNTAKPSAGSPADEPSTTVPQPQPPATSVNVVGASSGISSHAVTSASANTGMTPQPRVQEQLRQEAVVAPAPVERAPASSGSGTFVVQVAAVSHQEDADLLVNALQRKGYSVAARSEGGDRLVHIQIGPFSDHKEADIMKQRLASDGYNAIIKQL